MNLNRKIVIVGAGAAGLAAATKLVSHGFRNLLILEAENRFGGRINTIPFGANVLDMGAQWCHGEVDNVVYELAHDKGVLESSSPNYTTFNMLLSDGTAIPKHLADKITEMAFDIIEGDSYTAEKRNYSGSLGSFFAEKFNEKLRDSDFGELTSEWARLAHDWIHRMENTIEASDSWYETSCRDLLEYHCCDGDRLLNWRDKGYVTVFDLLTKKIGAASSEEVIDLSSFLQLNKEVRRITYKQSAASNGSPIQIECIDGSSYVADHLICTVSLGVLKERHLSLFDPILPANKFDAIESMGFGTVDKIYVEFEQPFWPADWEGFAMLWKPEQLQQIREDPINSEWLEGVVGFFPVNYQPNVLCGWITGPMARKMETMDLAHVTDGIQKVFRMFIRQWDVPDFKNVLTSKWHSNAHFRGSYTFYSLKGSAVGARTSVLAEPILDANQRPIIQFAGEATDQNYYSTVHGAIKSGWREAQRLIDLNRPKSRL